MLYPSLCSSAASQSTAGCLAYLAVERTRLLGMLDHFLIMNDCQSFSRSSPTQPGRDLRCLGPLIRCCWSVPRKASPEPQPTEQSITGIGAGWPSWIAGSRRFPNLKQRSMRLAYHIDRPACELGQEPGICSVEILQLRTG